MLPYWILFLVFAAGAVESRNRLAGGGVDELYQRHAPLHPILAAAAFVPIIMIGFRYEVGGDWFNYIDIFDAYSYLNFWESLRYQEPGYGVFNWFAHLIGVEIWAVNLGCALIFTGGLVSFARRQPNPWLAIVVAVPYLVIGVAMGYSRQAVALGCVMFGLSAVAGGSFPKFAMWVLLGTMFHRSAIVILPIVGLSYSRNRFQTIGLAAIAIVVAYYTVVVSGLDQYSRGYVEQEYESEGAPVRVAMNVVPALIFLAFQRRFGSTATERTTWRNISLLALASVVALFMIASSTIVDRLALYLIPLQIFVFSRLPIVFGQRDRPSGAMVLLVIGYSALIQFVWLNYANHAEHWIPFQFYPLIQSQFG
jgi:hypothetical protein